MDGIVTTTCCIYIRDHMILKYTVKVSQFIMATVKLSNSIGYIIPTLNRIEINELCPKIELKKTCETIWHKKDETIMADNIHIHLI